jgi:hypothetical protein
VKAPGAFASRLAPTIDLGVKTEVAYDPYPCGSEPAREDAGSRSAENPECRLRQPHQIPLQSHPGNKNSCPAFVGIQILAYMAFTCMVISSGGERNP